MALPQEFHADLHKYLYQQRGERLPSTPTMLTRSPSARVMHFEDGVPRDAFETIHHKAFRPMLYEKQSMPTRRRPRDTPRLLDSERTATLAGARSSSHDIHRRIGATARAGARPATCTPVSSCHMNPSETTWVHTQPTSHHEYPDWRPKGRAPHFPQPGQVRIHLESVAFMARVSQSPTPQTSRVSHSDPSLPLL